MADTSDLQNAVHDLTTDLLVAVDHIEADEIQEAKDMVNTLQLKLSEIIDDINGRETL